MPPDNAIPASSHVSRAMLTSDLEWQAAEEDKGAEDPHKLQIARIQGTDPVMQMANKLKIKVDLAGVGGGASRCPGRQVAWLRRGGNWQIPTMVGRDVDPSARCRHQRAAPLSCRDRQAGGLLAVATTPSSNSRQLQLQDRQREC